MEKPKEILKIFEKYTPRVEGEIRSLLSEQSDMQMYDMMSYFFGFLDEDLNEIDYYGGKRFRPGICLLLAEYFGVEEDALEVATAIEIFHNFTLIHDDIADNDEMRRGRPSVWKKWGVNQALNTGDAQLLLVNSEMYRYAKRNPANALKIQDYANKKFLEVTEGQHLDFLLSELPLSDSFVTEENVLDMMSKKSGILVGLSSAVSGMVAEKSDSEVENLWSYGFNLGVTYQHCDDIVSIWGEENATGKGALADIREKKKTLPIMYLYKNSSKEDKARLEELYAKSSELSEKEIKEVKEMLDSSGAKSYVMDQGKKRLKIVRECIEKMPISSEQKEVLEKINKALFVQLGGI